MHEKIFAMCEYDAPPNYFCRCNKPAQHKLRIYIKPNGRESSLSWNSYWCDFCYTQFKSDMINAFNRDWFVKIELKEFAMENTIDFEVKPK
jgi:hypothetical protein